MKKVMNDPAGYVSQSLAGLAQAHSDLLQVELNPTFVHRAQPKKSGLVGIVSGGGSGHEPLHTGFVGYGMLDAAVPGPVFTSPTPDAILAATRTVNYGAGVLYLVKNYTGDVLNFEVAAELAELEGIEVRTVIIADDVGVTTSAQGRRGVAGTLLVEKIVGAAAEEGANLGALVSLAEEVGRNLATMGVALAPCTVPHVGRPSFDLGPDEIEVGIGIHGEPGRYRGALRPADEITAELLEATMTELGLQPGEQVIVLVNSMGATSLSELYLAYRRVCEELERHDIQIARNLIGPYVTSLDMAGYSLTLLRCDSRMRTLFDAEVLTPAWRKGR